MCAESAVWFAFKDKAEHSISGQVKFWSSQRRKKKEKNGLSHTTGSEIGREGAEFAATHSDAAFKTIPVQRGYFFLVFFFL